MFGHDICLKGRLDTFSTFSAFKIHNSVSLWVKITKKPNSIGRPSWCSAPNLQSDTKQVPPTTPPLEPSLNQRLFAVTTLPALVQWCSGKVTSRLAEGAGFESWYRTFLFFLFLSFFFRFSFGLFAYLFCCFFMNIYLNT